jgi:hypothetical protein
MVRTYARLLVGVLPLRAALRALQIQTHHDEREVTMRNQALERLDGRASDGS